MVFVHPDTCSAIMPFYSVSVSILSLEPPAWQSQVSNIWSLWFPCPGNWPDNFIHLAILFELGVFWDRGVDLDQGLTIPYFYVWAAHKNSQSLFYRNKEKIKREHQERMFILHGTMETLSAEDTKGRSFTQILSSVCNDNGGAVDILELET